MVEEHLSRRPAPVLCLFFALTLSCGAGSVRPDRGLELAIRARPGQGLRFRTTVDVTTVERPDRVLRGVTTGTGRVIGTNPRSQTTVEWSVDQSSLVVANSPVVFPETHLEVHGILARAVYDEHGCSAEPPELMGAPSGNAGGLILRPTAPLPGRGLRTQMTWRGRFDWSAIGQPFEPLDGVRYVVDRLTEDRVRASFSGAGVSRRVELGPGRTLRAETDLVGNVEWSMRDALISRTEATATFRWALSGGSSVPLGYGGSLPVKMSVESCVYAASGTPASVGCAEEARLTIGEPRPAEREMARVYEGAACESRVARLEARLKTIPPIPPVRLPAAHFPEPEQPGRPMGDAPGPVLSFERDALRLDARPVESPEELVRWARSWPSSPEAGAAPRMAAAPTPPRIQTAPPQPAQRPHVWLALDRNQRIESALAALVALSRTHELRLVLRGPPPQEGTEEEPPPWVNRLRAELQGQPREAALVRLARAIEEAVGTCGALIGAFREMAQLRPPERSGRMTDLSDAVRSCRCEGLDVDALEALLVNAYQAPDGPLEWIPLPLHQDRTARLLNLPREATIQDLVRALASTPEGRPVRLSLR